MNISSVTKDIQMGCYEDGNVDYDSNAPPSYEASAETHMLGQGDNTTVRQPQDSDTVETPAALAGLPCDLANNQQSRRTKLVLIGLYFFLNLSLTISNKALLEKAQYPWLLTTFHASATSFGCFMMAGMGYLKIRRLVKRELLALGLFSILFTLNIAVSNISLAAVSVPFHQSMRALGPVATILIYRLAYGKRYPLATYLAVVPLVLGVALATVGEYYTTFTGSVLTALGVVLAAVKAVGTNRLVSGKLLPMEALMLVSPLATVQCILYAFATGELKRLHDDIGHGDFFFSPALGLAIFSNSCIGFALNIVSFQTNKVAGALSISVCGNLKQALTIVTGMVLFRVRVGTLNAIGMLITLGGAGYYSKVELDNNRNKA